MLDRHLVKVGNQVLGELLAGQCDVVLVDSDGLPLRLVQLVPLLVSADEVVRCSERVALFEGLNDEGDFSSRLPVCNRHALHDFGSHKAQADRHDGLRVRQQREGLRIVHAGMNAELEVITESMDLLRCTVLALRRMEATAVSALPAGGGSTVTDALSAKVCESSPGLEGVKGPWVCDWAAAGATVVRSGIHDTCIAIIRRHEDRMARGRCR